MKKIIAFAVVFFNLGFLNIAHGVPTRCTFEILENSIIFCGEEIEGADISTFEFLDFDYARDKNNVYYLSEKIEEADPDTFELVMSEYNKDKNNVYYQNKIIAGADSSSFVSLSYNYVKDKNSIYCEGSPLANVKPEEFELIDFGTYAKDKNSVYWNCTKLANSDPQTFQTIDGDFRQDKNNTYYQGRILDAERESFEVLTHGYAKDRNTVYFRYNKIPEADPLSFQLEDYKDYTTKRCRNGSMFQAWDKNYLYMHGMITCRNKDCVKGCEVLKNITTAENSIELPKEVLIQKPAPAPKITEISTAKNNFQLDNLWKFLIFILTKTLLF